MAPRTTRSRAPRLLAAGLVVAAGTAAVVAARRRAQAADPGRGEPFGPEGPRLPDGRSLVVTTDDGAQLAVTVAGPDDGPTILFSHCWTGTRATWAMVARALVALGHRVVLYDQRGHGESTNSEQLPSIPALGDDLRAVLEAVDGRDVLLVGHSMGGMSVM